MLSLPRSMEFMARVFLRSLTAMEVDLPQIIAVQTSVRYVYQGNIKRNGPDPSFTIAPLPPFICFVAPVLPEEDG